MITIKFTEDQILNKLKASYLKDKDEKTNFDFFDALAINSDLEIPNNLKWNSTQSGFVSHRRMGKWNEWINTVLPFLLVVKTQTLPLTDEIDRIEVMSEWRK